MAHSLSFVFLDGREIAASTPRGVIEALRAAEPEAPADLGRYLAMLAIRAGEAAFLVSEKFALDQLR